MQGENTNMSEKTNEDILRELTQMSRNLGKSERNLVIIGEGNTSALLPDGSYYLKASGFEMSSINEDGFVRLKNKLFWICWKNKIFAKMN